MWLVKHSNFVYRRVSSWAFILKYCLIWMVTVSSDLSVFNIYYDTLFDLNSFCELKPLCIYDVGTWMGLSNYPILLVDDSKINSYYTNLGHIGWVTTKMFIYLYCNAIASWTGLHLLILLEYIMFNVLSMCLDNFLAITI